LVAAYGMLPGLIALVVIALRKAYIGAVVAHGEAQRRMDTRTDLA
jgi:hypothetical protein